MIFRLICVFFMGALGANSSYAADTVRELSWKDLIPPVKEFDDPFRRLSSGQLYDLSVIAGYRAQLASGEKLSKESEQMLSESMIALSSQNIDVDGLLAQRDQIAKKRRAASERLDVTLDKHNVRIPGYLLPLDYSDNKVTQFLLVPTVGACIHVPPPPPNQMVYVEFKDGYEADGMYPPVWVEGNMLVGAGQSQLYLSDGAGDVTFGYRIDAYQVTDYQ